MILFDFRAPSVKSFYWKRRHIGIQIIIRIIYYPINRYPDSKLSVLSIPNCYPLRLHADKVHTTKQYQRGTTNCRRNRFVDSHRNTCISPVPRLSNECDIKFAEYNQMIKVNRCDENISSNLLWRVLRHGINCRCTYKHGSQLAPSRRH